MIKLDKISRIYLPGIFRFPIIFGIPAISREIFENFSFPGKLKIREKLGRLQLFLPSLQAATGCVKCGFLSVFHTVSQVLDCDSPLKYRNESVAIHALSRVKILLGLKSRKINGPTKHRDGLKHRKGRQRTSN